MNQYHTTKRQGAILAMALVCLLVVGIFSLSAARRLVDQHRLTTHQQYRLQSLWLAESAQRRAVAMLNLNRDYEGETWRIGPDTFANGKSGVAVIQVTTIATDHSQRQIVVESRYPDSDVFRVAHRMQVRIELSEDESETIP